MTRVKVKVIQPPAVCVTAFPAGPKGQGAQWRVGAGAPANSLGVDGDLYLDSNTANVYQKSNGAYALVANIGGAGGGDFVTYENAVRNVNLGSFSLSAGALKTDNIYDAANLLRYDVTNSAFHADNGNIVLNWDNTGVYVSSNLLLNAGNRIGVGTLSPSNFIDVFDATEPMIQLTRSLTDFAILGKEAGEVYLFSNNNADAVNLYTNNTVRVNVQASGIINFGPGFKMDPTLSSGNISRFTINGANANLELDGLNGGMLMETNFDTYITTYGSFGRIIFRPMGIETIRYTGTGIGIMGVGTPSAKMHFNTSSGAAGTAPLKFSISGTTLLATAEPGVLEPDSAEGLYYTGAAGVRHTIAYISDLATGYIPYSGANQPVNLNTQTLSSGKHSLGTTFSAGVNFWNNLSLTGAVNFSANYSDGVVQSGVTSSAAYYQTAVGTAAAAFTLAELVHYGAGQGAIGAGSAVTVQTGFNVASTLTGATTNAGFRGQLASATGRWNLYMDGTAKNYLAGQLGIGAGTLSPSAQLHVIATTEQVRIGYDANNYLASTLSAAGAITYNTAGTAPGFVFTATASTSQAAGTAISRFAFNAGSTQWATGALAATQAFFSIGQPTISFVASSTATLAASAMISGAVASGTNAIITGSVGLLIASAAVNPAGTVTTSYGLLVNASTGATSNYSASFTGGLGVLLSATNIVTDTTTGLKLATGTTQKLGAYGVTPIVQPTATTDLGTVLSSLGWRAAGTAYPITTSGAVTLTGNFSTTNMQGGYVAKTAAYTIALTDYFIDCTTGTFTVTLPTAVGAAGRLFIIKNSGTGVITIACNGAQTIDGVTTKIINTQYGGFALISDGAGWKIKGVF